MITLYGDGLVSLFNGISTLFRLYKDWYAKAILLEEQY